MPLEELEAWKPVSLNQGGINDHHMIEDNDDHHHDDYHDDNDDYCRMYMPSTRGHSQPFHLTFAKYESKNDSFEK